MTLNEFSMNVVRSVDYQNDTNWNYRINQYPYNTLYFVLEGDGYVRSGSGTVALKPEYVYLIPENTLYSCWCETHIHKLYVDVSVEMVPGMDLFKDAQEIRGLPFPAPLIHEMINRNTDAMRDRLWLHSQILSAISLFMSEDCTPPNGEVLRFKPVLDDIGRNLSARIRIAEIAARHGWHPTTLSRAFQRAYHCGIKRYVDLLLMSRLKQELIIGDSLLRELALRYGFCDAYYMSAFFKKHEGISPDEYRKNNRHTA